MRIVIAEDEGAIRMDLAETLGELGHTVVAEVSDGKSALEAIKNLAPDAAFLDIAMPVMDGLSVAEALKLDGGPSCPLILVTAFSDATSIKRATDAGVFGYIVKPFTSGDLAATLSVARARFDAEQTLQREAKTLSEQLEVRKLLDRAKGILVARGETEAKAYERIRKAAMDKRMSLGDVASAIILSDEINRA